MIEPVTALGTDAWRFVAPDGAEATVLAHGAHVVSWKTRDGVERLYTSPTARARPGDAVRGGVPVIFPQFNVRGPLPKHGLVRDRAWRLAERHERGGAAIGVFALEDDDATRAHWPHAFALELTVVVADGALDLELAVTNTGDAPFDMHAALHTYLRVDDVTKARLHGLGGVPYEDALHGGWHRQEFDAIGFVGAIDRVYTGVGERELTLASGLGRLAIRPEGFPDAVVWNPGPDGAAKLADLPDDDWRAMLCVEAGIVDTPHTLAAGDTWSGRQGLQA